MYFDTCDSNLFTNNVLDYKFIWKSIERPFGELLFPFVHEF